MVSPSYLKKRKIRYNGWCKLKKGVINIARKKREWYPGEILHIMNRGGNHQKIFLDESDYQYFLELIYITQQKFGYAFIGELSLDGSLRGCKGVLPMIIAAKKNNIDSGRNRLIAALAEEIHVVEAGKKSGSLITAEYGEKYGKKVIIY